MNLRELLAANGPIVLDGGLATELEAQGHDLTDGLWSARLLRDEPLAIQEAHAAYLRAGAQVTTTASYQASVESFHERRLRVLLEAQPDLIACETIPRADEAALLARLLDRLGAPPSWISFTCRDGRSTCFGDRFEDAVAGVASSPRVAAIGVNCTAPEHVAELLRRAASVTDLPLIAYPNSGRVWDGNERGWLTLGTDHLPHEAVSEWVDAGARLVGGCCGIGPAAIAEVASSYR
jgi:homocysteine S-methyltransferase